MGRVGEWLKPADCKSAAPCGLRRFESSPVHQALVDSGSAALLVKLFAGSRRAIAEAFIASRSPIAIFEQVTLRGREFQKGAAEELCAANVDLTGGNGFGLGSSVGRARPW